MSKVTDLIKQPTRKALNAITQRFAVAHQRPGFYRRIAPRTPRAKRS